MSVSVSVEPLSCSAILHFTMSDNSFAYCPCTLYKNDKQRGSEWAYWIEIDSDRAEIVSLPIFPLSPATDYRIVCRADESFTPFDLSFKTTDIPTAGYYSVNGELNDLEKIVNARIIKHIMEDNDNWSLNSICVMIGLLDSYAGLNPMYMWEQSSDNFTNRVQCELKYPWRRPEEYSENKGRYPYQNYSLIRQAWYPWLLATNSTDEAEIRKTTFGGFPYSKALFWSTMFQLKDLEKYDYDWYFDDKAVSIESMALILKYMQNFPGTELSGKAWFWNGDPEFKTWTKNINNLVDIAYDGLYYQPYQTTSFSPFGSPYVNDIVAYATPHYRDTIDKDLWKKRANYWYNYFKPKPPHKKHKMPIWEYLRYTI